MQNNVATEQTDALQRFVLSERIREEIPQIPQRNLEVFRDSFEAEKDL